MANPEDDLHSALAAAFEQEESEEVEAPAAEEVEQPRDDEGKFAAADEDHVREVTEKAEQTAPPRRAPSSWKPAAQDAFLKASRREQLTAEEVDLLTSEAERREGDYHKGLEQYKHHAHEAQVFQKAVEPYMKTIQSLGVDAPTAISRLLQVDHTLRYADSATKSRMFSQIAQEYGIDLQHAAGQPKVDPMVLQLQNQLQQQQMQYQQLSNMQAQREQAQYHSEIDRFASDPAHPYFESVKDEMALLLQSGKATDLKSAYDTAVWMRADTRQSLVDKQRAEAQRLATEQSHAAKAKSAAVSVKSSSPASTGVQPVKGSLREQLLAAMNDAS